MNEKLLCVYLCCVPVDRVRDVYLYFIYIYDTIEINHFGNRKDVQRRTQNVENSRQLLN